MKFHNTKGFALIMTLWVLVFLTIAVLSFTLSSRWSLASTANYKQETEAYYVALSGYDIALNYLMNDSDMQIDFVDEEGIFHVDKEHEPLSDRISLYNGNVEIKITDEQSKLNINRISQETLRLVLSYVGVESDVQDTLVDCLLDWVDADDAHHLNGVEDEYYEDFGYKSKNRSLDTVEELLLVKGYTEEILYGSKDHGAMYPLLTTFGNGSLNVNTVGENIMQLLGVNQIEIENIKSFRDKETGGLSSVLSTELRKVGISTTVSTYLRIEVSAEVKESGIKYVINAVAKRIPEKKGYRVETVFWSENVIYS